MLNTKDLNLKDTEVKETLSEIPLENNVNTTQKNVFVICYRYFFKYL